MVLSTGTRTSSRVRIPVQKPATELVQHLGHREPGCIRGHHTRDRPAVPPVRRPNAGARYFSFSSRVPWQRGRVWPCPSGPRGHGQCSVVRTTQLFGKDHRRPMVAPLTAVRRVVCETQQPQSGHVGEDLVERHHHPRTFSSVNSGVHSCSMLRHTTRCNWSCPSPKMRTVGFPILAKNERGSTNHPHDEPPRQRELGMRSPVLLCPNGPVGVKNSRRPSPPQSTAPPCHQYRVPEWQETQCRSGP